MTNDPLDAMKARWSHIQGSLFPWLREEVDPITEALGRLVTTLDVIGLEAFVPEHFWTTRIIFSENHKTFVEFRYPRFFEGLGAVVDARNDRAWIWDRNLRVQD
jgi:hypothetical protein